jgi:hypothetical protein
VALAVLAGALLVACGNQTGEPRALTPSETALLADAEQALIRECMLDQGFQLWVSPTAPEAADQLFPYGIDDVRWAQAHGYGTDVRQDRASDPNVRYVQGLSADRRAAYGRALNGDGPSAPGVTVTLPNGLVMGHSTTGCVATADTRLYGDYQAWFQAKSMTDYFDQARRQSVLADAAYVAAAAKWSACMRTAGFDYPTPRVAREKFLDASTPESRALEISTATQDAHCTNETGLANTAHTLDDRYANTPSAQSYRDTERSLSLAALGTAKSLTS